MAVYYKFKSAKDYDSVPMDGHFISVGHLKEKIFELKHLGGTDFDLIVTNAQTNEEYLDEGMLIPKNTSVLIRRVPGRPRKLIVTAPVSEQEELNVNHNSEGVQAVKDSFAVADQSYVKYGEDLEWDEFGNDLYAMPESTHVPSSIPVQDATPVSKEDEENKIKALIDTPALDWQRQPSDGFNGRGFARGGRTPGRGGFEKKTPPQGYICHRCKVPGHFIQHCPTNGDPNFDIRRVKPATGIPKSMLVATPDGSYAMASGLAATLKPNEAAFEKEIEGMPSTRPIGDLPRELRCPLCQEVMKDAVLTSKCCLKSFCDKCIRDYIISRSMCECGATSILADDLLPNKTVRDTINRILESNNNSGENGGSAFQAQGVCLIYLTSSLLSLCLSHTQCTVTSVSVSIFHLGYGVCYQCGLLTTSLLTVFFLLLCGSDMESRNPQAKVPSPTQSAASKGQQVPAPPPQRQEVPTNVETVEENKPAIVPLKSEKGIALKVPDASEATHDSRTVKEAASQGSAPLPDEEVQQKPISGEAGREKKKKKISMAPGGHGGILPYGPQRDLSELVGYNAPPPIMSRKEFEARKSDLTRKREMERCDEREFTKDREYGREGSKIDPSTFCRRPPPSDSPRPRASSSVFQKESPSEAAADKKHKASVFSRISFPAGGESSTKKRKLSSADAGSSSHRTSNGQQEEHKAATGSRKGSSAVVPVDHDSSDDERHFKRRPSRYTSSPPPAASVEEEHRHSRGSRDQDRGVYNSSKRR
ncbi:hypothetical protein SASPL_152162 [Salvia splendens]|uniref:DWNN domain-containing protein n=1 Tax=Salvia splendens TaxID=180675 RepID=A0A8X8W2S0_SALSN|nr:hypothetical protein SASPL_152162 [Salvia splendens]